MKNYFAIIVAVFSILTVVSAQDPQPTKITIQSVRQIPRDSLVVLCTKLGIPIPEERPLDQYIKHDYSKWYLDITWEEAEKLGVSKEEYDRVLDSLKRTNAAIEEVRAKGETVNFPD